MVGGKKHNLYISVLVLVGVESILFIVVVKCSAVFWICASISVDNTGMFSLLMGSTCTEPRAFLLLTPLHQRGGWGCSRGWGDTARTAEPNWPKGHSIPYGVMLSKKNWGKVKKRGNIWNYGISLSKQPLQLMKPCFAGESWTLAGPCQIGNEFLDLLFLCV